MYQLSVFTIIYVLRVIKRPTSIEVHNKTSVFGTNTLQLHMYMYPCNVMII